MAGGVTIANMMGFDEAGRHCLGSQIHDSRRLTRYPGHLGTTAHGQDLGVADGDGLGVGCLGFMVMMFCAVYMVIPEVISCLLFKSRDRAMRARRIRWMAPPT